MNRVLVTGGTGFIGRHCLQPLLDQGYEVHGFTVEDVHGLPAAVRWHQADLLDPAAVHRVMAAAAPTHLLHLAWYTAPGLYWTSTANLEWCRATLDLLRCFAQGGGRRVVAAGSCAEYQWGVLDGVCCEGVTPERPATLYGACKKAMHDVTMALDAQGVFSAAWGRVFFLYGPHEQRDRLVPSVVSSLLAGREALCTAGTQVRDFLHVADVAGALVALLSNAVRGAVNIASGRPVTLREVVRAIGDRIGRPEFVRLGLRPTPESEPATLVADVRRLRDEVGWAPTWTLEDGLDQVIQWWRAELAG